jgi:mRNA interferase RelE/StbE
VAYEIEFTRAALKYFDRLRGSDLRRISEAIGRLEENPNPVSSRRISGSDGLLRIRVGDYRIVYRIEENSVVVIARIGHRREVYRGL